MASYGFIKDRKLLILEKAKLEKQAKKWKNVLKTLEDSILICSHDSQIVFFNNSMKELLNYTPNQENSINSYVNFHSKFKNRLINFSNYII